MKRKILIHKTGAGESSFAINQEQKGKFSLFRKMKRSSLAMFGDKEFTCPEGHKLISMKTWRT
jgi:hypothetical protein